MNRKMAALKEMGIEYQCQVAGPALGPTLTETAVADMDVDKIDDQSKVSQTAQA